MMVRLRTDSYDFLVEYGDAARLDIERLSKAASEAGQVPPFSCLYTPRYYAPWKPVEP
jgi:hypothetical protein